MKNQIMLKIKEKKSKITILFTITLSLLFVMLFSHFAVESSSNGKIYTNIRNIPTGRVGLLLGCSSKLSNGKTNLFFKFRIDAAYKLLQAGKIEYLLISGDNSTKNYDETTDMQNALVQMGIMPNRLILDYAGFRTLDSVVRSKKVFSAKNIIIISQEFHNKRALYIADAFGISAIAYNAKEVGVYASLKTKTRELFARVKTILDLHILNTKPKFLGKLVISPISSS